jgi:hypothetical protein
VTPRTIDRTLPKTFAFMSMQPKPLPGCCAGFETEYAVAAFDGDGRIPPPRVSEALIRLAAQSYPNLPSGQDQGVHLTNGGKLYRERGAEGGEWGHWGFPEWATGECSSPVDLVLQCEAGHLLLERLCGQLCESDPAIRSATAFRHGIDHINRTSWATHFNVMTTSSIERLVSQLVPFLISKVIIGGAGGHSQKDRQFSIAPRCATIKSITSGTTTYNRGLLDTRQLSHCPSGLGRRQHLVCFENLCSQVARFVDAGSTQLIMRLIDAGMEPGKEVMLANPVAALQAFSRDPHCRVTQRSTQRRRHLSALAIQSHYLDAVRGALNDGQIALPAWTEDCCNRWEELLTALAQGAPESVADRLDWATKWVLFQNADASIERQLEIDIRYGALEADGIFRRLDEAGLLVHRIVPQERIERALHTPPPDTRARTRGLAVAEIHSRGQRGLAYWDRVESEGGTLDLSNPFEAPDPAWPIATTSQAAS